MSGTSHNKDSDDNLLFEVVALDRYIEPHLRKYAQTGQDKVDLHTYPSSTTIMKAFIAGDLIFTTIKMHHQGTEQSISERSFYHQDHLADTKKCQNNQAITLATDMANPAICPKCSTIQLVLCTCWLLQPNDMPTVFNKTKNDKMFYLTSNKIAELPRKAVWKVCPDTTPDNLNKYPICSAFGHASC
jgi:hypothetical protein